MDGGEPQGILIVLGAGCVLIPKMPLFKGILLSQVANGVLIPFVLMFLLKLVNRESLMVTCGTEKTVNVIAISTT
jgi:Mn2+/Fe2+ NRAMP family transporter